MPIGSQGKNNNKCSSNPREAIIGRVHYLFLPNQLHLVMAPTKGSLVVRLAADVSTGCLRDRYG